MKTKKKYKLPHLQTHAGSTENGPVTTKQLGVKEHAILDIV